MLTAWFCISESNDNTKTPKIVSLIDSFILSHRSIIDTETMRNEMVSFSILITLKTPIIVSLIDLTVQKNNVILQVKKIRKVFTNYKCKSDQISSGNSLL